LGVFAQPAAVPLRSALSRGDNFVTPESGRRGNEPHAVLIPGIQQQEEFNQLGNVGLIQQRHSAFGADGALPQTPPTFRLNRREPPAFDRRLWTYRLAQHRRGSLNRVPGIQLSRIPLSPAHAP